MRRWTLAVVVLLCGTLSFAYGDYVILIYNLGQSKGQSGDGGKAGPGQLGPGAGPIKPGAGGAGGIPTGPPQGAGALGGNRGPVPPGVGGGPPGGLGARGGPGLGAAGGKGGPPGPMGPGAGGMPGGYGAMGMFQGGYGNIPPGGSGGSEAEGTPLYVKAVVEVNVTRRDGKLINNGKEGWVKTPWGLTCLMPTNTNFVAAIVHHDTVIQSYEKKKRAVDLETGPKLPVLLELAGWTLTHGLIDQYQTLMKDVEALDPQSAAVKSFKQIDAEIKKPLQGADLAGMWKDKLLHNYETTTSDHYVLLHQGQTKSTPAEVKSRLNRLEAQFKMFYYWFGMPTPGLPQGQILPMPRQRLLAVLVPDQDEFERQQKIFESTHLVDDGFYARRENLVVFSQKRLDAPYLALVKHDEPIWGGGTFDRAESLKGKVPARSKKLEDAEDKICEAHTVALLEKALEEDAERAAVSHDGTRQLIAAAGLTTPGVVVPEWIQFGLASFFETPKGAPWTAAAYGHWDYRDGYKKLYEDKKLDKPLDALKGVVTDRFFRQATDPKAKPEDKGNLEMKARSTAWAVAYYLARNRMDGLLRYYNELSKLPRDMEFDDDVLLGCFARAFDLLDPATKKVDEAKLADFATRWHYTMFKQVPNEAEDFVKELKKNREDAMKEKPQDKASPLRPPGGGGGGPGAP